MGQPTNNGGMEFFFLFLYNLPVALDKILNEIKNTKYSRFIESYKKVHKVQLKLPS